MATHAEVRWLCLPSTASLQGIMMMQPAALPADNPGATVKRLWVHEVLRVFYDR